MPALKLLATLVVLLVFGDQLKTNGLVAFVAVKTMRPVAVPWQRTESICLVSLMVQIGPSITTESLVVQPLSSVTV